MKLFAARRPFLDGDVESVEHVEIFKDRITLACHRHDAKQSGRTGDLPSADGVAIVRRKTAEPGHVGERERSRYLDRYEAV